MSAVLLGPNDPPQKIQVGELHAGGHVSEPIRYTMPLLMPGEPPPGAPPLAAAIFIATGPDEYFAAGSGVKVTFSPNTPGPPLAGLGTVEEGTFVNGRWVPGRLLAGDSTEEGESIRIPWAPGSWVPVYRQRSSPDAIQRVTLYRYR